MDKAARGKASRTIATMKMIVIVINVTIVIMVILASIFSLSLYNPIYTMVGSIFFYTAGPSSVEAPKQDFHVWVVRQRIFRKSAQLDSGEPASEDLISSFWLPFRCLH